MQPIGFVYITINKINNKKYIGQHTKFNDNYLGSGKILQRAIEKYGEENFGRIILTYAYTQEELDERERRYISTFNAVKDKNFYNIHVGGRGGDTYSGRADDEKLKYKIKMSKITSGINNGMYGKKHSKEAIKKIKVARNSERYAKLQSEEFKIKMSKITQGEKNGMYGKRHSVEAISKMSKNRQGKALGEKNGMYGKCGDKALNSKKVYQYADKDMKILIQVFNSVQCVLQYLNIKGHSCLYKAIKEGTEYKSYYWSKEKEGVETIESI